MEATVRYKLWNSWDHGRLRPVKCWLRGGHVWRSRTWIDKSCDSITEKFCQRCRQERHVFRLFLVWGIPGVWRISFRVKHGRWT